MKADVIATEFADALLDSSFAGSLREAPQTHPKLVP